MKIKMNMSFRDFFVFLFVFFTMSFYTIQGSHIFSEKMKILLAFAFFPVIMLIFTLDFGKDKKAKLKYFSVVLIVILIFIYAFKGHSDTRKIYFGLAIYVGLFSNPKKLLSYLLWVKLIVYIPVFLTGGYMHINATALHGGMIVVLFIASLSEKIKWYQWLIIFGSYFGLWFYTDSGSLKIGLGAAILLIVLKRFRLFQKIFLSKIVLLIFPIALLVNIYAALCIDENVLPLVGEYLSPGVNGAVLKLVKTLDGYCSGRFVLAKYSLENFGVSFMGGNVDYNQLDMSYGGYFNLDSGFMWLLQGWGIMLTVIILFLFTVMMYYFIKTKQYKMIAVALAIVCWAVNEEMLFSVGTNFLIYFIGIAIKNIFRRGRLNEYTEDNPLLLVWRKSVTGKG